MQMLLAVRLFHLIARLDSRVLPGHFARRLPRFGECFRPSLSMQRLARSLEESLPCLVNSSAFLKTHRRAP